ncbi:unnamed protein product [Bursaphelenchus okinawaensis]|uniref:Uncharacterized protein n=1 Tax=Bursaphelenchus okinawaensis TaxID=465554 RepID=A0A811LHT8_9BILA|nr:unnamed protein product [Bursaphelenchus okinawaensis]CAG9125866.1 unnamed protein product [Bursaphelenchus okinawaensis]
MPLSTKRSKNVKQTGLKMSKKKAVQFKKSAKPAKKNVDVEMVEDYIQEMEIDIPKTTKPKTDKTTKKRVMRQERKDKMRSFLKKKIQKTKATNPDNMEAAASEASEEVPEKTKPKVNENRLKKADLPIVLNAKDKKRLAAIQKESKSTGMVSARRISKKKAKKIFQAQNRAAREKERLEKGMEL